jgi:hypothetical protein
MKHSPPCAKAKSGFPRGSRRSFTSNCSSFGRTTRVARRASVLQGRGRRAKSQRGIRPPARTTPGTGQCLKTNFTNRFVSPNEPIGGNKMGKHIQDEFTDLKISNQRRWQLRRAKEGRCIICGGRAVVGNSRCLKHNVQLALRNHERNYPNEEHLNGKWLKLAKKMGLSKSTQNNAFRKAASHLPVDRPRSRGKASSQKRTSGRPRG